MSLWDFTRSQHLDIRLWPAIYGCNTWGICTVPSSCWKFSSIATIMRGAAHAVAFSVCTNSVGIFLFAFFLPLLGASISSSLAIGLQVHKRMLSHNAFDHDILWPHIPISFIISEPKVPKESASFDENSLYSFASPLMSMADLLHHFDVWA